MKNQFMKRLSALYKLSSFDYMYDYGPGSLPAVVVVGEVLVRAHVTWGAQSCELLVTKRNLEFLAGRNFSTVRIPP